MSASGVLPPAMIQLEELLSRNRSPLDALRRARLEDYRHAAMPSRQDESWRKLDPGDFDPRNNELSDCELSFELQGERLRTFSIAEAPERWQALLYERFELELAGAADAIALARALTPSAERLLLPPAGERSVGQLRFVAGQEKVIAPRLYVCIEDQSELELSIVVDSAQDGALFLPTIDCVVGRGAILKLGVFFAHGKGDRRFGRYQIDLQQDAHALFGVAFDGGRLAKDFLYADLLGRGANFRGIGALALGGRDYCDIDMLARHDADDTQSSLHYKTVLREKAHSVFNGNLSIPRGRQRVNSHQLNNNILLDRSARAESMPRLVIQAERVQAEHGATVGELDGAALFYLLSRGLPESEARALLVRGFLEELLAEFPSKELGEIILSRFEARLGL